MKRPELNKDISIVDFNDFYWLKQELIDFCKKVGISTSGGKIEIADRIRLYIQSGETISKERREKTKSKFNWNQELLTKETIITDNYKNGENVRKFFTQEIGAQFSFNTIFMKWMRDNIGKTLGDANAEWKRIDELKKNKNYVSEIEPQFEYNKYIRAFLKDNPNLSRKDAIQFWKLKREQRGAHEYERNDLKLKEK